MLTVFDALEKRIVDSDFFSAMGVVGMNVVQRSVWQKEALGMLLSATSGLEVWS
jgi:hypothetical protein